MILGDKGFIKPWSAGITSNSHFKIETQSHLIKSYYDYWLKPSKYITIILFRILQLPNQCCRVLTIHWKAPSANRKRITFTKITSVKAKEQTRHQTINSSLNIAEISYILADQQPVNTRTHYVYKGITAT